MKIRLTQDDRRFLLDHAYKVIRCPDEEKADKTAYKVASKVVRKIVETTYPPKEMLILRKYSCTRMDGCISLQLTAGGVVQFTLRDGESITRPYVDNFPYGHQHIYGADEAQTKIIQDALAAESALNETRARKLADYKALFQASTTLEQVEAVWPAASALRQRKGRSLPVVLSDDVLARIRADVPTNRKEPDNAASQS